MFVGRDVELRGGPKKEAKGGKERKSGAGHTHTHLHVDEVELLDGDVRVHVEDLVELAHLCVFRVIVWCMFSMRVREAGQPTPTKPKPRTLKKRMVSKFLLLNSHHCRIAGVSFWMNCGGT